MLLHEESHSIHDNTHFKICLLCIFPVQLIEAPLRKIQNIAKE